MIVTRYSATDIFNLIRVINFSNRGPEDIIADLPGDFDPMYIKKINQVSSTLHITRA